MAYRTLFRSLFAYELMAAVRALPYDFFVLLEDPVVLYIVRKFSETLFVFLSLDTLA